MNKMYLIISLFVFINIIGCNSKKERVIEMFSEEKPFAIQIAKERSFYQAEKLAKRLYEMNIEAYIIQFADSVNDDGTWYYIMCEDIQVLDSALTKKANIEKIFNLKDLKIVKFSDFQNAIFDLESVKQNEQKKIVANKPCIKTEIFDVIKKFPESNSLFVQKTFVINTPKELDDLKGFTIVNDFQMDLPRGITTKRVLQRMSAFSEVVYKDNLYGDIVTIDIGKIRNTKQQIKQASIINSDNIINFEIAEEFADLILETSDYMLEEKKEIEVNSFVKLYGYKVTIEPKNGYLRTYMILVDETNQYVIFCQSTEKKEEELFEILNGLGKGDGLNSFDEFYNTFYTLPDEIIDNDLFIGFTIDRLDWTYADIKDYVKWAKEMVGHWEATGYFYNDRKGIWSYSIFDLLTNNNQNYIYGDLYSGDEGENKKRQKIRNTDGFAIYQEKFNWNTWTLNKKIAEISFGIERFVTAVNNQENAEFTIEELIDRAESLQFESSTKK